MKSIKSAMQSIDRGGDFFERLEQVKMQVLQDITIQKFIDENNVSKEKINDGLNKLYEFATQNLHCEQCRGLDACSNLMKGYQPLLTLDRGYINVHYKECLKKVQDNEFKRKEALFQCLYLPSNLKRASMSELYHDEGRYEAVKEAVNFFNHFEKGRFMKGLYLHGPFGTGKTYILAAIANELSKKGIDTLLVHTPEFMREVKASLQDHSLQQKMNVLKNVTVLMFDDFGAESMSSWGRDDILGSILQYRMIEELPVFFSSNLSFKELNHHLTYSQRGEVEELKAERLMERIKVLSKPIEVTGKNYRN